MSETTLGYVPYPGSIGASLELESLAELSADALADLRSRLDERGVVCVRTRNPPQPLQLAVFERYLGLSAARGAGQPLVAGTDFLADYSIPPRIDDGRPPKPAVTDVIHIDITPNGPAAFGVHATLSGSSVEPMRFADMRAVYAAHPGLMSKLVGLRARHVAAPGLNGAPAVTTLQPLAARHPGSGAALLLLPNRRDAQVETLSDAQASGLIGELWHLAESAPGQLEIPLQPNTLIIWDNILCTHSNPRYARAQGRVVWFFNTINERPLQPIAA